MQYQANNYIDKYDYDGYDNYFIIILFCAQQNLILILFITHRIEHYFLSPSFKNLENYMHKSLFTLCKLISP